VGIQDRVVKGADVARVSSAARSDMRAACCRPQREAAVVAPFFAVKRYPKPWSSLFTLHGGRAYKHRGGAQASLWKKNER
jgi:hypothetical protein